jgi:hypothetical protein
MQWFRVDEAHLMMLLREIGCVITKKEDSLVAKLKPINLK